MPPHENEIPRYLRDLENLEEDSPYPEVRASVSNTDDPDMPCLTFRVWVVGLTLCIVTNAASMYLYLRASTPPFASLANV